jgi:hypothetical protein
MLINMYPKVVRGDERGFALNARRFSVTRYRLMSEFHYDLIRPQFTLRPLPHPWGSKGRFYYGRFARAGQADIFEHAL